MNVNRWNLVRHSANHVANVVTIEDQHCHAMYLHCYHMNAAVNGSMDFVSQPTTVLGVISRYLANELDAPAL